MNSCLLDLQSLILLITRQSSSSAAAVHADMRRRITNPRDVTRTNLPPIVAAVNDFFNVFFLNYYYFREILLITKLIV